MALIKVPGLDGTTALVNPAAIEAITPKGKGEACALVLPNATLYVALTADAAHMKLFGVAAAPNAVANPAQAAATAPAAS